MTFFEGLKGMGTVTYAWLVSPSRSYSRPCMYIHTCLYEKLGDVENMQTCLHVLMDTFTRAQGHLLTDIYTCM